MEKKLHETKEKAFQVALADARAAGVPEEAAEQQAMQAANEAAEKSEFARLNENLAGDAQVRNPATQARYSTQTKLSRYSPMQPFRVTPLFACRLQHPLAEALQRACSPIAMEIPHALLLRPC